MRAAATALMPYAQAVQDMLSVIPQARLGGLAPLVDPATGSLVGAVLQVDKALDSLVSSAVEGRIPEGVFSDLPPTVPADVAAQASQWREVISGRSWKQAERFGTLVTRKIQGAKDAIAMSADPVSQAATSLIELIDRLLREAYSDDQVMRWVVDNYAHEGNMTFLDGGRPRPTKRAQALCFVHAGQPRDDEPQVRELLADVIVSARTSLQGLKHADRGTPDELGTIEELMAALEGWFMVGVVLAWATLPEEVVNDLYDRIAPREPVVIPQEAPASIPA
jgi:hypothetical protein